MCFGERYSYVRFIKKFRIKVGIDVVLDRTLWLLTNLSVLLVSFFPFFSYLLILKLFYFPRGKNKLVLVYTRTRHKFKFDFGFSGKQKIFNFCFTFFEKKKQVFGVFWSFEVVHWANLEFFFKFLSWQLHVKITSVV